MPNTDSFVVVWSRRDTLTISPREFFEADRREIRKTPLPTTRPWDTEPVSAVKAVAAVGSEWETAREVAERIGDLDVSTISTSLGSAYRHGRLERRKTGSRFEYRKAF